MALTRIERWEERLDAVIERHRTAAFAWGMHDCATIFADAVHAVTGVDPFAPYRPWDGPGSALRRVREAGADTVRDFVASSFAFVPPALARRGDVGFTVDPEPTPLCCPAVILGAIAVSWSEAGFVVLDRQRLTHCYAVG